MAGKKGMRWARSIRDPESIEEIRKTIDAFSLVKELKEMISGKREMQPHQVTAAIALLRKCLPDLQSTELTGDPARPVTVQEVGSLISRLIPDDAAQRAEDPPTNTLTH